MIKPKGYWNENLMGVHYDHKQKLPKGKYKYVYGMICSNGDLVYQAYIPKYRFTWYFNTEREAAICVDKIFIKNGKEPINILKKKL